MSLKLDGILKLNKLRRELVFSDVSEPEDYLECTNCGVILGPFDSNKSRNLAKKNHVSDSNDSCKRKDVRATLIH